MKLNNKGFAISSIMYIILVLGVILISLILVTLSSRKLILDKLKNEVLDNIYNEIDSLPNEYQRVDYIENTGTQYIDAGFIPKNNMSINLVYQIVDNADSQYITGAREIDPGGMYRGKIIFALSGSKESSSWTVTTTINEERKYFLGDSPRTLNKAQSIILIDSKESRWIIKDLTNGMILHNAKTENIQIPETTLTMNIFAFNKDCIHNGMKLYSYTVYQKGKIIRNFIPCYKKSDGEIGLYDTVEKLFYTNRGEGVFKKGNDI